MPHPELGYYNKAWAILALLLLHVKARKLPEPSPHLPHVTTNYNRKHARIKLHQITNIYQHLYQVLAVLNGPYLSLPTCANHFLCAAAHPKLTRILPGRGRAAAEIGPGPPPSSYLWELRKPLSNGSNSSCLLYFQLTSQVIFDVILHVYYVHTCAHTIIHNRYVYNIYIYIHVYITNFELLDSTRPIQQVSLKPKMVSLQTLSEYSLSLLNC